MQRVDNIFKHWMTAERSGREAEAERALARLFAVLPAPLPSAGFADRVLAGAGLRAAPAVYPWWSRAAIAACLMVVGMALAYTLPLTLGLSRLVAPGEVAATIVSGFVAVLSRIDELFVAWRLCANVAQTLMLVVTSPPVFWTVLTLSTLSAFTLRGLSELVSSNRKSAYVQAL